MFDLAAPSPNRCPLISTGGKTAGIELEARSVTTGLVSGLLLDLASDEFSTSVAAWLADERVTASSSNLATGPGGVLKLTGLPHGTYTWRALAPTGELVTGTAVVPPGGIGKATVVLP